jgi:NADH-quinone oxidoreductase subunit J
MKRLLCCLLALGVAVGLVQTTATAQPAAPAVPVQVRVSCPVGSAVTAGYPGSVIESCDLTHGQVKTPTPEDEFTVRAQQPDGTRLELVMLRTGKLVRSTKILAHSDRIESQGIGMALLFWAFAAAAIAGALFVITRRNLIAAVMGMVGSFLGIAAIYMMLFANFLAVVQMLVYAGAIMVLFVFVIMVLNRPEDEPVAPTGRAGGVIGGIAILYLVGRLVMLLIHVQIPKAMVAVATQAPKATAEGHDWGSVKAVGTDLFSPTSGLFPFEAISILLLVAVVGAIAIARPLSKDDGEGTEESP